LKWHAVAVLALGCGFPFAAWGQIGGSLSGAGNSAAATFNLTTEGTADWVHWGDTALNRKSGVATPQIGNYTLVGSGQVLSYSNDPRTLSWTDGTPAPSDSNANGLYISAPQNGFSFTAAADSNTRSLTVHVGGYYSGGTLTAHLSDASAADYVDTTAAVTGQYDRNYTLSYSAASAGHLRERAREHCFWTTWEGRSAWCACWEPAPPPRTRSPGPVQTAAR
jgi:hypothetical protein